MFSITISDENLTRLYMASNNKRYDNDLFLLSAGKYNKAFFCMSVEHYAGLIAVPVYVKGEGFDGKNYKLLDCLNPFVDAANAGRPVRFEIDDERKKSLAIYDSEGVNHNVYPKGFPSLFHEGVHPVTKALLNEYRAMATIKLPDKIPKGKEALFDIDRSRVGIYKFKAYEGPDYSVKKIKPLEVIHGQGRVCYYGNVIHELPWKKGTVAEILENDIYVKELLRYEIDGLICIVLPLSNMVDDTVYEKVFGKEIIEDGEIWIEEDDDFLTKGANK